MEEHSSCDAFHTHWHDLRRRMTYYLERTPPRPGGSVSHRLLGVSMG